MATYPIHFEDDRGSSMRIASAMFLLALAPALANGRANTFDFGKVGPLQIGMSQEQVERVLGSRIKLTGIVEPRAPMDCGTGDVTVGSATLGLLFDGNQLQTISFSDPGIRMKNGLGVGSRARDIERAYGRPAPWKDDVHTSRVWSGTDHYDENDHQMTVEPSSAVRRNWRIKCVGSLSIQFDIGPLSPDSKVREISVGEHYAEGCA